MYSKGADVDALRASAHRMTVFGREVDQVRATSRRAVSTMQQAWAGPDLQHLLERWRRVEHELVVIGRQFDDFSRRLHENAEAQGRSSGRGGHVDAHGGPSGHRPPHGHGHGNGHGHTPTHHPTHQPSHQPTHGATGHPVGHVGAHPAGHDVVAVGGPDGGRPHAGAAHSQWQAAPSHAGEWHAGPVHGAGVAHAAWAEVVGSGWSHAGHGGHGGHGAHLVAAAATHLGSAQWAPSVHWAASAFTDSAWAPAHGAVHAELVGPVRDPAWVAGVGHVLGLPGTPAAWWDGGRPVVDPGFGFDVPHVTPYGPR